MKVPSVGVSALAFDSEEVFLYVLSLPGASLRDIPFCKNIYVFHYKVI